MSSYCPQTRYEQTPNKWDGGDYLRFATQEEAEAYLAQTRIQFPSIIETRIIPSPKAFTMVWYFEHNTMAKPRPPKNYVKLDKTSRPRGWRRNPT